MRSRVYPIGSWIPRWIVFAFVALGVLASSTAYAQTVSDRIRSDLISGRDVIIASYVALWNPPPAPHSAHVPDPYWDALYGHDTFFDRRASMARHLPFVKVGTWTTTLRETFSTDPVALKVMTADHLRLEPGTHGRMIVIYLAYFDRARAMRDMTIHLKTGKPPAMPGASDSAMRALRSAYVLGYWGHNNYHGGYNPDQLEDIATTTHDFPRGAFVVGCQTALWYPQKVLGDGIEPLLFTSNKMPPEGYVAAALYDGLARGLDKRSMRWHVARAMQVYHEMSSPPVTLFVNTFERIGLLQSPMPAFSP